jgi:hypothetical protein
MFVAWAFGKKAVKQNQKGRPQHIVPAFLV